MHPDPSVIHQWSASAPYWEKHRDIIRHMFAPVTQALALDARIAAGHKVLDIATGPGEPALSLATLVGPEGEVVGVDLIPEMIAAARRAAADLARTNATFEVASAGHLPFPAGAFDAVVSRFGVMFFPSPIDAVREILRVLKPGQRFALAAWCPAASNPFFDAVTQVIDRYVAPAPAAPDAPNAFRFASPGKLLDVLTGAGAIDATERVLTYRIEAPLSVEEFWTLRFEMSETIRGRIEPLSKEQAQALNDQILNALRPYSTPSGMSVPSEVLIASATKPNA